MSGRAKSSKLDLKLNLSPPTATPQLEPTNTSTHSREMSPEEGSCLSSELQETNNYRSNEEETITSMVLVGCPRCLMYVMLSGEDPKCPKCKSTVLLDFLNMEKTNKRSCKMREN